MFAVSINLTVFRKSLQARLKKASFQSDKDRRDKESKTNSSSLGSSKEGSLIDCSKVVSYITSVVFNLVPSKLKHCRVGYKEGIWPKKISFWQPHKGFSR